MLCNCTVGADAFDSANSRAHFKQNIAANFRFSSTQAPFFSRPTEIGLSPPPPTHPPYTNRPLSTTPLRNSRGRDSYKSPVFSDRLNSNFPGRVAVFILGFCLCGALPYSWQSVSKVSSISELGKLVFPCFHFETPRF